MRRKGFTVDVAVWLKLPVSKIVTKVAYVTFTKITFASSLERKGWNEQTAAPL
jgi:hypothetical protein